MHESGGENPEGAGLCLAQGDDVAISMKSLRKVDVRGLILV